MKNANLLILIAVLLPPKALDILGKVVDERTLQTPYGDFGPLALRRAPGQPAVWVGPYTGLPTRTDPRATLIAAGLLGLQRVLIWDEGCGREYNAASRSNQLLSPTISTGHATSRRLFLPTNMCI